MYSCAAASAFWGLPDLWTVIDAAKLLISLDPSADKVPTATNVPANLGSRPALIVLLAMNNLQTKLLRDCDVLLLHHS